MFVACVTTLLFVLMLWLPPYLGLDLQASPTSNKMVISRIDPWVEQQGLRVGDEIVNITGDNGLTLDLLPKHLPKTTFESRRFYEDREQRIKELGKVYDIVSQAKIIVTLSDGRKIHLNLDQRRPLSSVSWEVWFRFFLGLSAWLMGALVWAWRPKSLETVFLMVSSFGLFLITFPAAASIYTMEAYFVPPLLIWFLSNAVVVGDYLFIGFGTCLLLYFPQKLPNGGLYTKCLLYGLLVYSLICLFNDWKFSRPIADQFLYFGYNETYGPMPIFFAITLGLCFYQWRAGKHKPVEKAQALWIALAWTVGPSIFMVFYLLPVLLGYDAILSRTWTSLALMSTYWMVLVGVARFQLFELEHYIGAAYQWVFISLFFFSLDILLVSVVNVGPQTSTFIILCLVLWCYLPARQWFHNRIEKNRQISNQELFKEAVIELTEGSLISNSNPQQSWYKALKRIFLPVNMEHIQTSSHTKPELRGQSLIVANNRFSQAIKMEFAQNGTRLFTTEDQDLVITLSRLFERLFDFRDAYFAGQTQERERIRRDLHDQIGHKLLSMIYTVNDAKSKRLAQDMMAQLRELIRAIKREPVPFEKVMAELKQMTMETCDNTGLSVNWQDHVDFRDFNITSNQHLNILNIIRELLNNTIKHARADNVTVSISDPSGKLQISVADNGKGFNPQTITRGNGIYNIESRVQELNAEINWEPPPGARVSILMPLTIKETHHGMRPELVTE